MRRVCSIALASVLICASGAQAEEGDLPVIDTGTIYYWTNKFDGGTDKFHEKLAIKDGDVEIYQTLGEYVSGDASDYYALFSGIEYRSCQDDQMPSAEDRKAIAALWPLETGKTVTTTSNGEPASEIEIGEPTQFFLMGEVRPAHKITINYPGKDDATTEELTVLDDLAVTVAIRWNETDADTLQLITGAKQQSSLALDRETLGNCVDLFVDAKQ